MAAVYEHGGRLVPDKRPFLFPSALDLSHSSIDDQSLQDLSGLTYGPELLLDLSNTKVSDAGLTHLAALRIDEVRLAGSRVTPKGVEWLRTVRPDVAIVLDE